MRSTGTSIARRIIFAAALAGTLCIGGCYYYGPAPYAAPASFDRSWDAAAGAIVDNGFTIVSQDRSTGTVVGKRGGIEVVGDVRAQADGSVRVEFNSRGSIEQDPGLMSRVAASYNRRMGR